MKKYIVCFFYMMCIIVMGPYCFQLKMNGIEKIYIENSLMQAVSSKIKTLPTTVCIIEIYDEDCKQLKREQIQIPQIMVGKSRQEIIQLLKNKEDVLTDKELKGYESDYTLIHFSAKYVMIRKTYRN